LLLTVVKQYATDMAGNFSLRTAFSRDGPEKVYVQDRMREAGAEINELLERQRAYFYVCGDAANMAREVNTLLAQIIARERGVDEAAGEEVVKRMRASGQYQEDVWS
jgi:NADPH-ferrihemoprotein reductase